MSTGFILTLSASGFIYWSFSVCSPPRHRAAIYTLTWFFMPHPHLLLCNNPQRCIQFLVSPPNLTCPFCRGQTRGRLKSWPHFNQSNRDVAGWTWWFWTCFPTLTIPRLWFFRFTPCLPVDALSLEGFCIITLSHNHLSGIWPVAKLPTGVPVCRAGAFTVPGNVI